jgi:hypothetical protein
MGENYGKPEKTYRLHGRIHTDFLALYRQELARRAQTQQTVPADKVN